MEALKEAGKVIKSKRQGKEWVEEALAVLVGVSREIKVLEKRRDEESEPFKSQIKDISNKYKPALDPLNEIGSQLRGRVMVEYEGTETISEEGVGKLVFPESWGYEVEDFSKVEKKYRMEVVDNKAIIEEIKNGVRKIKGLEIKPIRSLRVLTNSDK